ncbi:MAG: DMT family transporter [Rhodobacteraceae bacterium]|jgi:drug/metabolite transporter (DMT)-like permease|uniref:DMT family transporter n=1 Tax=Albidovulum sp. TaxID=1872424 RepID=UPI001D58EFD8|nr:DMT family transporter [uncultured Defluviimonas sp.]MCB2124381.1 DMT family transporter [Paracoccaceae bacterium]MCC0071300.1 DMT family transporter [Paracoccaceae bacterium]
MTTLDPVSAEARTRIIGVFCIVGGMLFFSLNDMGIKFLSGDYALHQVVLIRTIVAMAILLAVVMPLQGGYTGLRTRRLRVHILRGVFVVFANMLFFVALAAMPLAEAVAISFVSPLLITALSVLLLSEKVGPRRWLAVGFGLLGVIVILRPGTEAFRPVAILPLLGAVAYAMVNILTRRLGGTESAVTLAFYIQITFVVVSAAMGLGVGDGRYAGTGDASLDFLLRAWMWPEPGDWPVLAMLGIAAAIGSLLVAQGYRLCEAALAAPFEYTAMPLAVFWGVVVFGDWPDAVSWTGIALILAGGLYLIWRETRRGVAPEGPRARR